MIYPLALAESRKDFFFLVPAIDRNDHRRYVAHSFFPISRLPRHSCPSGDDRPEVLLHRIIGRIYD